MDPVGAIGAAAGVVGAAIALLGIAQARVHFRGSKPKVSVACSYAIPVYGPPGSPEFKNDDQVEISVRNAGGAPVTIVNYGVEIRRPKPTQNLLMLEPPKWATPLPHSLPPHGAPARLLVPVDHLRRVHREHGIAYGDMHPWVELGNGARVFAKASVPLK